MSTITKITLMFVVFVDLIGQGLVFPIINTLIMEPSSGFLPEGTSVGTRHFDYGLVIGIFFLAWFLGVVYVAKVSDSIGRKNALLICLGGALVGYAITVVSLYVNSLWLLIRRFIRLNALRWHRFELCALLPERPGSFGTAFGLWCQNRRRQNIRAAAHARVDQPVRL